MRRGMIWMCAGGALACAVLVCAMAEGGKSGPVVVAEVAAEGGHWVAGPGRVEPVSEVVQIAVEMSGKIETILAGEGDKIRKGQTLATLANAEYKAALGAAEAMVKDREAARLRLENGARAEEKAEARAVADEMAVRVQFAKAEFERQEGVWKKGGLSRGDLDRCECEYRTALARSEAAKQRLAVLDAGARDEDKAMAEAAVLHARAQLEEAKARYAKTILTSPLDGVVLRKYRSAGESVSAFSTTPDVLFAVGDLSRIRVRVEMDEVELGKVKTGQKAYVVARAFGAKKFTGKVVQTGLLVGKKNVRTGEPGEYVDTKVFEILIELDDGHELSIGMRVDGFVDIGA